MNAAGFPKEVSSIWWLFSDVIDCSPCLCETFLAGGDALCVRDPDRMGLGWVDGEGGVMLLVLRYIRCLEGEKLWSCPQQRHPQLGCEPWRVSQTLVTR